MYISGDSLRAFDLIKGGELSRLGKDYMKKVNRKLLIHGVAIVAFSGLVLSAAPISAGMGSNHDRMVLQQAEKATLVGSFWPSDDKGKGKKKKGTKGLFPPKRKGGKK